MKNLWRTSLIFAAFAIGATTALAQMDFVEIENIAKDKRKICVYDANDKVGIIPKQCFVMNSYEMVFWNRHGDRSKFNVKIFKPGLLDEYLYTRDLPGDTRRIIMAEGNRFGFSQQEAKPTSVKYRLKVCNKQYDARVYFVLGFETNKGRFTEGWWNLGKGQCLDFPVSENLKNKIGLEYGNLPRTLYYARTYGDNPMFWQGGNSENSLCVTESNAFSRLGKLNSDGTYDAGCSDTGFRTVNFRRLNDPKTNEEWYYITF